MIFFKILYFWKKDVPNLIFIVENIIFSSYGFSFEYPLRNNFSS